METEIDQRHLFQKLFDLHGNSSSKMLDNIFEFLLQVDASTFIGPGNISGEHLINYSYQKARRKYLQSNQMEQTISCEDVPSISHEVEISDETVQISTIKNESKDSYSHEDKNIEDKRHFDDFDITNGAKFENYAWTQTIDDIEVRVLVPSCVTRGKQVKCKVENNNIKVSIVMPNDIEKCLLMGKFAYPIKSEETIWLLHPTHIQINIDKKEEKWWNKLLVNENEIDLKAINAERPFSTLPEDDQAKIQEMMWNEKQKTLGKPTSDQIKMESILRKAWDADDSPFKGQPFDPSSINFTSKSAMGLS